jgi:hypothetical protein
MKAIIATFFTPTFSKLYKDLSQNLSAIDEFLLGTTLSYAFFQDKYQVHLKKYKIDEIKSFTRLYSNQSQFQHVRT